MKIPPSAAGRPGPDIRRRRRSRRSSTRKRIRRAASLFLALGAIALVSMYSFRSARARAESAAFVNDAIDRAEAAALADTSAAPRGPATHQIRGYSAMPGGAYSAPEVTATAKTGAKSTAAEDGLELDGLDGLVELLPSTHLAQGLDPLARVDTNTGAFADPGALASSGSFGGAGGRATDGASPLPFSPSASGGGAGATTPSSILTFLHPLIVPPSGGDGSNGSEGDGSASEDPPNLTNFSIGDAPPAGDPELTFTPADDPGSPDSPNAPVPTPEPGTFLLVGGSAAIAALRKKWRSLQS